MNMSSPIQQQLYQSVLHQCCSYHWLQTFHLPQLHQGLCPLYLYLVPVVCILAFSFQHNNHLWNAFLASRIMLKIYIELLFTYRYHFQSFWVVSICLYIYITAWSYTVLLVPWPVNYRNWNNNNGGVELLFIVVIIKRVYSVWLQRYSIFTH